MQKVSDIMGKRHNPFELIGERFGKLKVISEIRFDINAYDSFCTCLCDCGRVLEVRVKNLKSGYTKSCGCTRYINSRNKYQITYNGVTKNVHEWSKIVNIAPATLISRIKRGWSDEDVLFREKQINIPSHIVERAVENRENNFK